MLWCIYKDLNYLEGIWLKPDRRSWLLYGYCWSHQRLSLKSWSYSPVYSGLSEKFLFFHTESALVLICPSHENLTIQKVVFFNLIWSLKLPRGYGRDDIILGSCPYFNLGIYACALIPYSCKWTGHSRKLGSGLKNFIEFGRLSGTFSS